MGRKEDERDLHSKREFCMRQVRPGKYCKNNFLCTEGSKPHENIVPVGR